MLGKVWLNGGFRYLSILAQLIALIAFAFPSQLAAQEDVVPIGWESSAAPSGIFPSADAACYAQWDHYMNNGYSRYIGTQANGDDWRKVGCLWTQWQYLCTQENPGAGFACGTIYPAYARVVCPSGYIPTKDGYCKLNPSRERECPDSCDGGSDNGKPNPKRGNPVVVSTGAKSLQALDYTSSDGQFRIGREYRSFQVGRPIQHGTLPRSQMRGLKGFWNFEFMREVQLGVFGGSPTNPNATVAFLTPDGVGYGFTLQADGTWVEDTSAAFSGSSNNLKLEFVGTLPQDLSTIRDASSTWRVTDGDDTVWIFETRQDPNGGPFDLAWPTTMVMRSGYSQAFTYAPDTSLSTLTDSFGRSATFQWSEFEVTPLPTPPTGSNPFPLAVSSIILPDGTTLDYEHEDIPPLSAADLTVYTNPQWGQTWSGPSRPSGPTKASSIVLPKHKRLKKVTRSTQLGAELDSVTYEYENEAFARNITGIVDHRGERVASYTYDNSGRVSLSELADGVNATAVAYSTVGDVRKRVVANALGQLDEYSFEELTGSDN